ncbi:MAG: BamA/TamA family outer membrane protein, partial [Flavobacteriales bacterium]|nr:BamA/TamA family outer membrane protein [Flavobacteriales bacterium]
LEVADPNFNTWWRTRDLSRLNWGFYIYRYNSRGMNETADVQFQFGYAQQYGLHYKVPFIDRKQRWGLSLGGGYYQQHEVTTATVDNERIFFAPEKGNARTQWNATLELTLRRAHDLRHAWRLGYSDASVQRDLASEFPDHLGGGATHAGFLFLRYTIIHDNRDSRAYPLQGHFGELQVERQGLGLLSDHAPDITRLSANWSNWWPLSARSTLALALRGKTTFGPPTPYFVQEGLGYRNYVRGYEYQVIDGQHYLLGKLNAVFQLLRPIDRRVDLIPLEAFRTLHLAIYANAFVDAGYVIDDQYGAVNALDNTWMSGYGIGLDLVTSYDQVVRGELTMNAQGAYGFFLHFTNPF